MTLGPWAAGRCCQGEHFDVGAEVTLVRLALADQQRTYESNSPRDLWYVGKAIHGLPRPRHRLPSVCIRTRFTPSQTTFAAPAGCVKRWPATSGRCSLPASRSCSISRQTTAAQNRKCISLIGNTLLLEQGLSTAHFDQLRTLGWSVGQLVALQYASGKPILTAGGGHG